MIDRCRYPRGSRNLAFISQFVEIPEDVVFTVEYSAWQLFAFMSRLFRKSAFTTSTGARSPTLLIASRRKQVR